MQRRRVALEGLRPLLWGVILMLMILVGVLVSEGRGADAGHRGAVWVSARAGGDAR